MTFKSRWWEGGERVQARDRWLAACNLRLQRQRGKLRRMECVTAPVSKRSKDVYAIRRNSELGVIQGYILEENIKICLENV